MAVSMKNVDVAFQAVGQKPYPSIICMFLGSLVMDLILNYSLLGYCTAFVGPP